MQYDADVIIIGSGHNSLTAALYLQKGGHKVLMFEQCKQAGGASKSGELLEEGFKHDIYATNVGQFLGSQVYAEFKNEIHKNGFDIVAAQQPFANVFPNGKCMRMYMDGEKTLQEFSKYSTKDAESWKEMIAYFTKIAPFMFPILQLPVPSLKILNHFYKMYKGLGLQEMLQLVRILLMPPRHFLDEWFESDETKALMSPWSFHLGLSPDSAGGATFCFLESVVDHLNGMALSKGGVSVLIEALVKMIQDRGGKVVLGQKVSKIVISNGKAQGVVTEDGTTYYAKKAVLANVTPNQFIRLVGEEALPSSYYTRCEKFQYGPGTLMIHLTMDKPLVWEAAEDMSDAGYVHIGPYMSDIATTYNQITQGLIPSDPMLCIAQQSRLDNTRAPEGKHVLWIQTRAFPQVIKGDAAGKIAVGSWESMKEPICERILDKVAQYAPNVRDITRKMVIHTPQDMQDDDPNIVGGDMVGGSHQLYQYFLLRPVPGWSNYKTPVKSLYLTGQSTWPGCGMNAAAGHLAAMQMLKDL
jgi:phytoene dehydrogenase-like protein